MIYVILRKSYKNRKRLSANLILKSMMIIIKKINEIWKMVVFVSLNINIFDIKK